MNVDIRTRKFYDCHCHILPGLDDGARSLKETKQLLRREYMEGIRTIIATPHFQPSRWKQSTDRRDMVFQQTRCLAKQIDPNFRIYLWNEAYWEDGLIYYLKNGDCRSIGDGYILIENRPDSDEDTLYRMADILTANNYIPVFAHIERYHVVRKRKKIVDNLKKAGAWIQVNSDSITGKNGFRTAMFCRMMLKNKKIDLLGTDSHRVDFRPPEFRNCTEYIKKNTSREYFKLLMNENPRKLLKKEEVYDGDQRKTTMV